MLTCEIDRTRAVTVLQLTGDLWLGNVHEVRAALLKCVVECPEAVVVDLSRVHVEAPVVLTVFGAVARRVEPWSPVPLVLTADSPDVRARLESATRLWQIPVYGSLDDALANAPQHPPPVQRVTLTLRPATTALPHARTLVNDACRKWGLGELALPAELVVSELVSNAVQHAGTDLVASAVLRRGLLHLTVSDGDPNPPRKGPTYPPAGALSGRGLLLVDEFATAWGWLPIATGKVVWATFRVS
jgi:anti-anti-sigma regulatory factor